MCRQLIPSQYSVYSIQDNPIELDDISSGSYAVYLANNPNQEHVFVYTPDEYRLPDPRCDYFLTSSSSNITPRFIELKGSNKPRRGCCENEWGHAFHQLYCTYEEFKRYIFSQDERFIFVLCISMERGRSVANFAKYTWYKELQNLSHAQKIIVLYSGEYDNLDS